MHELHDGLPDLFLQHREGSCDLGWQHVERHRQWDSCFNWDFSYVNGGLIRNDVRSRYRQWLTHKLATWMTSSTFRLRRLRPLHHLVPGGDRPDRRSGRHSGVADMTPTMTSPIAETAMAGRRTSSVLPRIAEDTAA